MAGPSTRRSAVAERTHGNDVYFIDGVRTPFGRAGERGAYLHTRADDLAVKSIRALVDRNPSIPADAIDDVAIAATTQQGDQGLTLGRSAAILAGLPESVPGYAIDRMCAGALTAITTAGAGIAFGAYDVVIAGGVEHMGRHPIGSGADPNPRFVAERLVDAEALNMGRTAERLHDRFPALTRERADRYGVASQRRAQAAYAAGRIQPDLVPVAVDTRSGWTIVDRDEHLRPGTDLDALATLRTPFRPHGRVTAGNASPLTDGASATLLASTAAVDRFGLEPRMRMVSFAFAGVEPEVMGLGPVPSTRKALARAGLGIDDIGLFELNEAFAVQVLAFLEHYGLDDDEPTVNPYGGAIALGHPLAASGGRLATQLAREFAEHPEVRFGITALCVGLGQGATIIWENTGWDGRGLGVRRNRR